MFTLLQVWRPRVVLGCNRETVLLVDVHRGHLTDEFRDSLKSQATGAAFIPPGCCCRLQPLDVCLTPVLRDFLQVPVPPPLSDLSHLSGSVSPVLTLSNVLLYCSGPVDSAGV